MSTGGTLHKIAPSLTEQRRGIFRLPLCGVLPASGLQFVLLFEGVDVDADHGLAEVFRDADQDLWIVVVGGGLDDGFSADGRVAGL